MVVETHLALNELDVENNVTFKQKIAKFINKIG